MPLPLEMSAIIPFAPEVSMKPGEIIVTRTPSVSIKGNFEKWNGSIKFSSRDVRTAVLDIEIQADSVSTGSHMKDNKLKGKDFFNVKESPTITFKSTKVVQTGPSTFDIEGSFTIRGVTKTEKLTLTSDSKGTPTGSLYGIMAFDRKDYGMTSGIPFIKIANRVEVNVRLKWRRVSGPPPEFQQRSREQILRAGKRERTVYILLREFVNEVIIVGVATS